jgi:hypothetical protein
MRDRSLRRRTDRIEDVAAWLLTATGILVLIVATMLGVGGYAQGMERVRSDQADRVQATAVLLQDAPDLVVDHGATAPVVFVPARWSDVAGAEHEGKVMARSTDRAGDGIPIWLDHRGQPVGPPAVELTAVLNGVGVALVALVLGGGLIVGAWTGLRRAVFAHNTRAWEREWARIGPEWNSQQPT